MDKPRASKRTETEVTVKKLNKSRYISSERLSDKSINIEQPKEINARSDSPSLLSMSRPVASITTVLPDKKHIPCKIKGKKISEIFIKGKNYSRTRQHK